MKQDKDIRIGIIGAGPAGLTAAEALINRGYKHVTILEKQTTAGGKCRSFEYDGRSYELGAGIISINNQTVASLIKKYNIKTQSIDFSRPSLLIDGHTYRALPVPTTTQKIQQLYQGLKYIALIRKYKRIQEPGFTKVHSDLCAPFTHWAKQHNATVLIKEFSKFFTGFGYDFLESVPAAYALKYFSPATLFAFLRGKVYTFPNGIQHLWTEVAKHHDVRYNMKIQHIKRDSTIHITTEHALFECDKLIVTSPLDEALKFIDASTEEQELFSNIQYCDYSVTTCHITNFPKHEAGYLPDNFHASRKGQPIFWYHRYAETDLYNFYTLSDASISDDTIQQNINSLIKALGGNVKKSEPILHWKYFPHVTGEQMQNGYYDRLEKLQSQNNTYYAGELHNFSMIEQSAAYAKDLVERYF